MSPAKKAVGTAPPAAAQAKADQLAAELAGLSYEAARDQLLDVVRRLESGGESLEESLTLWERGEALAKHCESWLDGARQRIEAATAVEE